MPERASAKARQGSADLAISWTKTPKGSTIPGGAVVRYVVSVRNAGPDAASGVTLDLGFVTQRAKIVSGAVSDGARCTKEDVVSGLAFFVHCSMGTLGAGASKNATLQLNALRQGAKNGGAILVATLSASSTDSVDPDDSNGSFLYLPGDPIQYSMVGQYGGGKTTAKRIRAKVLIAPYRSQSTSSVRYRAVNVFNSPAGARSDAERERRRRERHDESGGQVTEPEVHQQATASRLDLQRPGHEGWTNGRSPTDRR